MATRIKQTEIDVPFKFSRKPMPVEAELRPDWKMASLLLMLHMSSIGGKSSLKRLHVLNWALRTPRHRIEFEEVLSNPLPLFGYNFRFEPAFSRAIDMAVGERLVEWVGGDRIKITEKGTRWVSGILADETVFINEREFLKRIGKKVTEKAADRMLIAKGVL